MKLIAGLGNPGKKYEKTRHNIGFMVLEQLLKDYGSPKNTLWQKEEKLKSDIAMIDWQPKSHIHEKVILVKPNTFMNNSGMAISLLKNYYKIDSGDIWVVHDDIDLQVGALRIRKGGGAGGHRGLESIIASLGGDFWRFRLGIGRPQENGKYALEHTTTKDIDDYVLGDFTGHEWGKIRELIHRATKAVESALEKDLDTAMNKFNTK